MTLELLQELALALSEEERCARWKRCPSPHPLHMLQPMEKPATSGPLQYCPICLVAFTAWHQPVNAPDCPETGRSTGGAVVRKPRQSRKVRVSGTGIVARMGTHIASVLDLSETGALLLIGFEAPVASDWMLQMEREGHVLQVTARVMRMMPAPGMGTRVLKAAADRWRAGVAFIDLSPDTRKAVGALVVTAYADRKS